MIKLATVPKCDYCDAPAVCDSNTVDGTWAYTCGPCQVAYGVGAATRLEQLNQKPETGDTVQGIEESSLEDQVMGDRYIGCPSCGESRLVEPDAEYSYMCECGDSVQVPDPFC